MKRFYFLQNDDEDDDLPEPDIVYPIEKGS